MRPDIQDATPGFSVIYGEEPLYFSRDYQIDIKAQLEDFQESTDFSAFKNQYNKLLCTLEAWCHEHNCCVMLNDELARHEEKHPAFELFRKYLFDQNNYYEKSEEIFFNEGKKNLEELVLLLKNEQIFLDEKTKILTELQIGLSVCADGIQTNIQNAKNALKACTGINETIQQIKTEFIQQNTLPYIQDRFGDEDDFESFEIHYTNTFCNEVAQDFGLSEQEDSYISGIEKDISPSVFFYHKKMLQEEFAPRPMLELLLIKLRSEWSALHAKLSEKMNALRTNISSVNSSEIGQDNNNNSLYAEESTLISNVLEQWNQKYGALITLGFYDFVELDDTNYTISILKLSTLNENLEPKIIKRFSEKYIEPNNRFSLHITPDLILRFHNGLLWAENDQQPELLTLEHIESINTERLSHDDKTHYCQILEQLFQQFPKQQDKVLNILTPLDEQFIKLIWDMRLIHCIMGLNRIQRGEFLKRYFQEDQTGLQDLISRYPQKLLEHLYSRPNPIVSHSFMNSILNLSGDFEEIGITTLLGYAAHAQCWNLIHDFAEQEWLTQENLLAPTHYLGHRYVNVLWAIIAAEKWELFDELQDSELITLEQLKDSPSNEDSEYYGCNALFLLCINEQWEAIEELLDREEITIELLEPIRQNGVDQGINILLLLVCKKQWELIDILLEQDLITPSMLEVSPLQGKYQGVNVLSLLCWYREMDLFNHLLEEQLITTPMLASTVMSPEMQSLQGMNVLSLLIKNKEWNILEKLFRQEELITSELLRATQFSGSAKRFNILWVLAAAKQEKLINILSQKQLITPDMLGALSVGNHEVTPLPYWLACIQRWGMLKALFNQEGLMTTELLEFRTKNPILPETSLLWILVKNQQWDLVDILLKKQLITTSMLAAIPRTTTPFNGTEEKESILYLLGNYQQWEILKRLFNQNELITTELLSPIVSSGLNQGINLLLLLTYNQQWELINTLLQKQLITSQMLAETPRVGGCSGVNTLYLLCVYQQWDLINALLQQQLITSDIVAARPTEGDYQNYSLEDLLNNFQQEALIEAFAQQNLLAEEQDTFLPQESYLSRYNLFNVTDNKERKRKNTDEQYENPYESSIKKRK